MTRKTSAVSRSHRWVPLVALLGLASWACEPSSAPGLVGPSSDLSVSGTEAPSARALEVKSTFVASLTGSGAGTESKGAGEAIFRFGPEGEEVSIRLNVANVENVTMAHIHIAATPGGDGPPAVWLYPGGPPPSLIPGRSQGSLASGTFTSGALVGPLAGMNLLDLRQAMVEGRAYVNVHTLQFPGGEIRGAIQ